MEHAEIKRLIMQSNAKNLLFITLLFFSTISFCKEKIQIGEDLFVDNCEDYNKARIKNNIFEGVMNSMYASEYLECSLLDKNFKKIDKKYYVDDLKIIFNKFTLRSIPSSLGPRISREDTLFSLGGKLDIQNAKISLISKDDNFVLSVKGKIGDKYLVWIVDEILTGTYRSYYPALLTISGDKVTASPFYESGY